jgi:prevent-host-death family protein
MRRKDVIMQYISATETKQTLAAVVEKAKQEPVIIREQNRDVAVVLSFEEYQRMLVANIQEFQQFRKNMGLKAQEQGLTEDKLNELLATD